MICPIKNSDAWKFHEANNTNDYLTWNLNNGNPLNLDKNGNPSVIFDQLLKNINSDRESNPFDKFLNESIKNKLQRLYPEIDLTYSNNPIWEKGNAIMNQSDIDSAIKYKLKTIDILQSPRAEQMFAKGEKAKWDLNKILTELAIPKEQKQLLLDLGITDREQLALELASKYGYSVEINTAKSSGFTTSNTQGRTYEETEEEVINKIQNQLDKEGILEPGSNEYFNEVTKRLESSKKPTSYYSNLTVPGGTNYTENEISTPLITPSIKGHAQFSTDKGIGWFRSDERGEISRRKEEDWKLTYDEQVAKYGYVDGETEGVDEFVNKSNKTRRILEVQSDLFQKGRDKEYLTGNFTTGPIQVTSEQVLQKIKSEEQRLEDESDLPFGVGDKVTIDGKEYERINGKWYRRVSNEYIGDINKNQFLQLLNKDSNWVKFFISSIIQDSAKKGYEKVLFPKGETAAKIEGHETIAEEIRKIDKEIKNNKEFLENPINLYEVTPFDDNYTDAVLEDGLDNKVKKAEKNIIKLEKQKQELKSQGIEKLKPIEGFYEIKVGNILEKLFGKDNVKTITDEYGNEWREITINQARDLANILLQKNESEKIIGQANIKAMSVLIDVVNQKQDTLPHEYAHHYIAWYRESAIVKKAIEKWGSEEKLVQAIGEQVVKQKGEVFDWWNKFSKWLINKFSNLSAMQKEDLKNILTDAFLKREDLDKNITSNNNNFKDFTTFELSEEEKSLEEELRKNCSL